MRLVLLELVVTMAEQQEKAYQKQDNVFLNSKAVLMKTKTEKQLRYYKAVGLGTSCSHKSRL